MSGILIIAHAPLASALEQCVTHIWSACPSSLKALDVQPDADPAATLRAAEALLAQVRDAQGALVLTDVFGATPCNIAQKLAAPDVRVLTGVNLPMLMRSVCYGAEPLEQLAARAVAGGTQGVMQVAYSAPRQQSNRNPPPHDPTGYHHQQ
jgi:PTS system ascorbate-specific IIA component